MNKDSMYRSLDSIGQTVNNRLAKSPPEEPDASIAHVRVCEGPGRQRPGLLGKKQIGMGKLLVFGVASFLVFQPAFGEDPVKWELIGPAGLGGCHYSLSIDPTDDNVLYYSPDCGGLYRTMDGGKSWKSMSCIFEAGGRATEYTTVAPSNPKVVYTFTKWEARGESWRLSRSNDRFETAEPVGPNGVTGPIAIEPTDENIIYVGMNKTDVYAGKIFKSTDGGKTWTNSFMGCSSAEEAKKKDIRLGTGYPGSGSIVIDPGSPKNARILYVSGTMGVYKSIDGGNTWQEANSGLPHKHADTLAFHYDQKTGKRTLYVTLLTIKGTCDGGIYRSIDEGATWQNAGGGLTPEYFLPKGGVVKLAIVVNSQNADVAYYGAYVMGMNKGLLKTEDGGKSWERVTFTGGIEYGGPPEKKNMEWKGEIWNWVGRGNQVDNGLVISQQNPDIVYYCDYHSMFKTSDGGKTWQQCYTRKLGENRWQTRGAQGDYVWQILPSPYDKNRLYVTECESALFCSFDRGNSFLNACLTLPDPLLPPDPITGLSVSHDRFSSRTVAIAPDNPEIVYSTGRLRYGGSVIISRNGGKTWSRGPEPYQLQPNENYTGFSIIALKNKKVLLTTLKGGLFLSEDEANSWQEIDTGLKPEEGWKFFRLYPSKVDRKRVYAVATAVSATSMYTLGGTTPKKLSRKVYGIYRSDDEGRTWNPLSNDLEGIGIAGIAFSRDEKIMYAVGGTWNEGVKEKEGKISHETGGVYKSEDGGVTWKRLLSGSARDIDLNPKNHDIIYIVSDGVKDASAGRDKRGIIRSLDGGKTWECIGNKITPALICVSIDPHDPSIIYVGTRGSGAWKGIDGYVKETMEKKGGVKEIEKKGGGKGNWLKNIFGGVVIVRPDLFR